MEHFAVGILEQSMVNARWNWTGRW
jgi:hypothetical protein